VYPEGTLANDNKVMKALGKSIKRIEMQRKSFYSRRSRMGSTVLTVKRSSPVPARCGKNPAKIIWTLAMAMLTLKQLALGGSARGFF
jgi:hypothetical protein